MSDVKRPSPTFLQNVFDHVLEAHVTGVGAMCWKHMIRELGPCAGSTCYGSGDHVLEEHARGNELAHSLSSATPGEADCRHYSE